ncbi:hypothetical protein FB451DRAFT_1386058 [Mycena latifolia]|nr:hypothetical protein FB451DRAFT_1386058 [Mycena latifolia]
MPRDTPSSPDIKASTQIVIMEFLQGQNVNVNNTFHFLDGWLAVDFAGANAGNITQGHINAIMSQTFDPVASANGSDIWFSTQYINFLQELNKALPTTSSNNSDITDAQNREVKACGDVSKILNDAIPDYLAAAGLDAVKTGTTSDPGLREWANTNYAPLITANVQCEDAQDNLYKVLDTVMGDDFAQFAAIRNIISILTTDSQVQYVPGVNMEISDPVPGLASNGASGEYVPEYYISILNGTLSHWQSNIIPGGAPTFFRQVTTSSYMNDTQTTSGGGGMSFVWDDVSGSGSGSGSTTTSNATSTVESFTMGFGGITLMSIDRGSWFDGFKAASAAQHPPDNVTQPAKPVFDRFFGTAANPGVAARYNRQALIGYQPSWTITTQSSSDFNQLKSAAAGAEVCFLFLCANAHGSSSSNKTKIDDSSMTITFQDTSNNAYILGYVIDDYWNGQ